MVSRVSIPETAWQSPTLVLKTLVLLNDSYAHEGLEISLHMLPDDIDHQSVFGIAQLLILNLLASVSRRNGLSKSAKASTGALRQAFLRVLKASLASAVSVTCLFFLQAPSPGRCSCKGCAIHANPLMNHQKCPTKHKKARISV